jgi:putative toxin-antitoxin system antitoxin component (TIGR02293 family)
MATLKGRSAKKTGSTGAAAEAVIRSKYLSQAQRRAVLPDIQVEVVGGSKGGSGRTVTEALMEYDKLFRGPGETYRRTRSTQTVLFAKVYKATPQERIGVVKGGVSPAMVGEIADALSTTTGFVIELLGLKRSTIARKQAAADSKLSLEDSEKLVGLAKLAGQVEVMVKESGELKGFDSGKWLAEWLNEPIGALGGKKPAEYMDTNEGQAVVSNLLLQIQYGVYA